jgi:HlyD family secretion protein
MPGQLNRVIRHLRHMVGAAPQGEHSDAQLLQQFAQDRDETAFAALVQRHGPLVLGVCRRLLPEARQAEDAFQATFVVLARQAASIRRREVLASWLYRVAYQTAVNAKNRAAAGQKVAS